MDSHEIEPALHHTPPRQVARRGRRGMGNVVAAWVVLLPLALLCLFMLLLTLQMIYVRACGRVAQGVVTNRSTDYDSKHSDIRYRLDYEFLVDGRRYTQRTTVNGDAYIGSMFGSNVPVQYATYAPGFEAALEVPGTNKWTDVGYVGGTTLLIAGLTYLAIWVVLVLPRRNRLLVSSGVPVAGRLVDKTKHVTSRSQSYCLLYEYAAPAKAHPRGEAFSIELAAANVPYKGKQSVFHSDWNQANVGDSLTVLYDARKPGHSLLYKYADYEAV